MRAAGRTRPARAAALAVERGAARPTATGAARGLGGSRWRAAGGGGAAAAGGAAATGVGDALLGRATAAPALHSDDLEVHSAQVHAGGSPSIEVVLDRHSATGTTRLADADILVEGRCALDGRLVDTLILPDGVCAPVRGDSALLCPTSADPHIFFH